MTHQGFSSWSHIACFLYFSVLFSFLRLLIKQLEFETLLGCLPRLRNLGFFLSVKLLVFDLVATSSNCWLWHTSMAVPSWGSCFKLLPNRACKAFCGSYSQVPLLLLFLAYWSQKVFQVPYWVALYLFLLYRQSVLLLQSMKSFLSLLIISQSRILCCLTDPFSVMAALDRSDWFYYHWRGLNQSFTLRFGSFLSTRHPSYDDDFNCCPVFGACNGYFGVLNHKVGDGHGLDHWPLSSSLDL